MNNTQAVNLLGSIAQEARLAIFRLLVQSGTEGLAAGVIGARLDIANSTLSFHLKALAHAGLINARQDGRFIYYAANYEVMNALLHYLTENCCAGENRDCGAKIVCCNN